MGEWGTALLTFLKWETKFQRNKGLPVFYHSLCGWRVGNGRGKLGKVLPSLWGRGHNNAEDEEPQTRRREWVNWLRGGVPPLFLPLSSTLSPPPSTKKVPFTEQRGGVRAHLVGQFSGHSGATNHLAIGAFLPLVSEPPPNIYGEEVSTSPALWVLCLLRAHLAEGLNLQSLFRQQRVGGGTVEGRLLH